ncbi:hypothetical protein CDD80_5702 [Ophiocordyceps camponoti-rufipedis]|uniref:C2H2-type domain-containing protein n=1 Tax=Ophiocordyceps camponoti-rufipedis TaxID=2004952 RepID=A0A2C5YMV9_9HYPO|nr:hypothetical protein CDD80_5702 [Ophiocordyceps camponoti-rufipedis]
MLLSESVYESEAQQSKQRLIDDDTRLIGEAIDNSDLGVPDRRQIGGAKEQQNLSIDQYDMASQSPDRHGCHCGKSFLRKEHLRRHQATHGGPAFSCQVCGRSFSRSDLLRRHASIHGGAAAMPDSRRGKACDTCHANKTRCDGGLQCSLCSKRGVACTYGRRDAVMAATAAEAGPAGPDDMTISGSDSPPDASDPDTALSAFSPAFSFTPDTTSSRGSSTTWAALRSILGAVAARSSSGPTAPPPPSAVPKAWLAACVETYLTTIHQRWPLLHGPTVDETTDNVALVASMVMMTAWLHCDRSFRQLLMEMHGLLVDQCFKQLTSDNLDPSRAWPLETYQVTLLNVVFALESGRAVCISKCRHLLSLLVAALRANGCFDGEAVERQRRTHWPGDFVPWAYAMAERWRRLAACAFQVDTYLSLLCNQPPLLRREELALGLPSTFSIWNAYGLEVFFARHRDEPWRRGSVSMSCLDMAAPQLLPSAVLIEDVQICLLGAWNDIWLLQQLRRNRHGAAAPRAEAVARQLRLCKIQLDGIADTMERPDVEGRYGDLLLRAYAGKELHTQPGWRQRVLARVTGHVVSARMLYHLLRLHLHADLQALRESDATTWQRRALMVREWALSTDGRAALLQAVLVWRTYGEATETPADAVVYMALSAAATVLSACIVDVVLGCVCRGSEADAGVGPLSTAESAPGIPEWLARGGGLCLHGLAVCRCNAATWLTRFAEALARGGERWELGSMAASDCLSRLDELKPL